MGTGVACRYSLLAREPLQEIVAALWGGSVMIDCEWESIETAPMDGTWILLAGGICSGEEDDEPERVVSGQFSHRLNGETTRGRWMFACYDGGYYGEYDDPTHWMPLPKSPGGRERMLHNRRSTW